VGAFHREHFLRLSQAEKRGKNTSNWKEVGKQKHGKEGDEKGFPI
jgi:hypothetical protein